MGGLPVGHRHRGPGGSLPLRRPGVAVRRAHRADARRRRPVPAGDRHPRRRVPHRTGPAAGHAGLQRPLPSSAPCPSGGFPRTCSGPGSVRCATTPRSAATSPSTSAPSPSRSSCSSGPTNSAPSPARSSSSGHEKTSSCPPPTLNDSPSTSRTPNSPGSTTATPSSPSTNQTPSPTT